MSEGRETDEQVGSNPGKTAKGIFNNWLETLGHFRS